MQMLTLIEPYRIAALPDRPYLGCAMLIAACKSRGIKTDLIAGQSRWLKDLLSHDRREIWQLIRDLDTEFLGRIKLDGYRQHLLDSGEEVFIQKLRNLNHLYYLERSPRSFFKCEKIVVLNDISRIASAAHRYYLGHLKYASLSLVRRYIDLIRRSNPGYIGFSIYSRPDSITRFLIDKISDTFEVPLIFGGPYSPFLHSNDFDTLIDGQPNRYILVGMAEKTLPDLIESLESGGSLHCIPGLVGIINGTRICNKPEMVTDLDHLPHPDFSQFKMTDYISPAVILPIQTARGCTWRKCAFCAHSAIYQNGYYKFSIDKTINTIRFLSKSYKCRHFAIQDEQIPPQRMQALSLALIQSEMKDVRLYAYARLDPEFNDDTLLDRMYTAGFRSIAWGLESGSQQILNKMRKGTQVDQMRSILTKCHRRGITNLCFVMFGFPGESIDDAQQTVVFLERLADAIDIVMMGTFSLYDDTPIHTNLTGWGVKTDDDGNWEPKKGLSRAEAKRFLDKLEGEINLGKRRISRRSFVTNSYYDRMMLLLMNSYMAIENKSALKIVTTAPPDGYYPMVLGEATRDTPAKLKLVNVSLPLPLNLATKGKLLELGPVESECYRMANGQNSLNEIHDCIVHKNENGNDTDIQSKVLRFFKLIFSHNSGYLFKHRFQRTACFYPCPNNRKPENNR
jgi:radical SAM superfamily enzyme YgiQ (UPF0313 family)